MREIKRVLEPKLTFDEWVDKARHIYLKFIIQIDLLGREGLTPIACILPLHTIARMVLHRSEEL